jgi:hypothetical protein
MKTLTFSDICDIISKLDREENEKYIRHMENNPSDDQRKHDHIVINAAYCKILYAIHGEMEENKK